MTAGRETAPSGQARKPEWLKRRVPQARPFRATQALLDGLRLHTVCQEARCPNKGECYAAGTATFLILGDGCTRACRFCSVRHGRPVPVDADEPRRVAEAARQLGLRHVVITSVTRDDLPDGGAAHYAATIAAVRAAVPTATIEVLIPDLGGEDAALSRIFAARPDVLNHNLETVPRLYPTVRPQADYRRSLALLARAARWARASGNGSSGEVGRDEVGRDEVGGDRGPTGGDRSGHEVHGDGSRQGADDGPRAPATDHELRENLGDAEVTGNSAALASERPLVKTGFMLGLGERAEEVEELLRDCAAAGVDVVTIGQYLQPNETCLPVARYVPPDEFADLEAKGAAMRLRLIAAPFVRSSYHAGEVLAAARETESQVSAAAVRDGATAPSAPPRPAESRPVGASLRAVLLDVDGTIMRFGEIFSAEGYVATGARHGLVLDAGRWREGQVVALREYRERHKEVELVHDDEVFRLFAESVIRHMGGDDPAAVAAAAQEIIAAWDSLENFSLYDDVVPILTSLAAAGLACVLVSNTNRDLDAVVTRFGLERLVSATLSSAQAGYVKPSPRIFAAALRLVGVRPGEAIMVGDSYEEDYLGARGAGLSAVLLDREGRSPHACPTITTLAELPHFLGLSA